MNNCKLHHTQKLLKKKRNNRRILTLRLKKRLKYCKTNKERENKLERKNINSKKMDLNQNFRF